MTRKSEAKTRGIVQGLRGTNLWQSSMRLIALASLALIIGSGGALLRGAGSGIAADPTPTPTYDVADYFMFAQARDGNDTVAELNCDGSNDAQTQFSGQTSTVWGRLHSNADLTISSPNTFVNTASPNPEITYGTHDEDCQFQAHAGGSYGGGGPTDIDTLANGVGDETDADEEWPGELENHLDAGGRTFNSLTDVLGAGATCDGGTSLANNSDITIDEDQDGQIICNGTGKVTLNAQNQNMDITIISHGEIVISGQGATIRPVAHGIMAWTDLNLQGEAIKLSGSNMSILNRSIFFAPQSGIDVSGSDNSTLCVHLVGQGLIKVAGSNSEYGPLNPDCADEVEPEDPGTITICKTTLPDNVNQDFDFDVEPDDDFNDFDLNTSEAEDCEESGDLEPGVYSIAETGPPAGWTLSNIVCTIDDNGPNGDDSVIDIATSADATPEEDDFDANDDTVSIDLAEDEHITCTFTNRRPDVSIDKTNNTGGADVVDADGLANFNWRLTITVTNGPTTGPAAVTDTIPAGMTVVYPLVVSSAQLDCSASSGSSIACTVLSGTVNGSYTVDVPIDTPDGTPTTECTSYNNTGFVSGGGGTNTVPQDSDAVSLSGCAGPDVSIAKTNSDANGIVQVDGDTTTDDFNWILTVTVSNGPTTADATITDTIPAAFLAGAPQETSGDLDCTASSGNSISCTLDSGAIDGAYVITIPIDTPDGTPISECTTYINTGNVTGGGGSNSVPSDNDSIIVEGCNTPGASIEKTNNDADDEVIPGDTFNWIVTLTVTGAPATGVISDTVPDGFTIGTIVPEVGSGITCDDPGVGVQTFNCSFTNSPVNTGGNPGWDITIPVTVEEDAECGLNTNEAQITQGTGSPDSASNSVTVLCPLVNLAKANNTGDDLVSPGDPAFNWVVTVTVSGAPANSVITDTVPDGFVIGTITTEGGSNITCEDPGPGDQIFTCTLDDTPVGSWDITIPVTPPDGTPSTECGQQTNIAIITSGDSQGDQASDSVTVVCPGQALLTVEKDGPATVASGGQIDYTIIVTNVGDSAANNVVAEDDLPDGLTVISATFDVDPGAGGDTACDVVGNIVTCELGTLAASNAGGTDTAEILISVTVTAAAGCGEIENVAEVEFGVVALGVLLLDPDATSDPVETDILCGSITIVKEVPGTDSQNFSFDDDIPDCEIPDLDDDAGSGTPKSFLCEELPVGTYSVTENVPGDWDLDDIDCDGDLASVVVEDVGDETATVTLNDAEDITCTFFNDEEPGDTDDEPDPTPTSTPRTTTSSPPPTPTLIAQTLPAVATPTPTQPAPTATRPAPTPTRTLIEEVRTLPRAGDGAMTEERDNRLSGTAALLLGAGVITLGLSMLAMRKRKTS